jgi:hypothetical protein
MLKKLQRNTLLTVFSTSHLSKDELKKLKEVNKILIAEEAIIQETMVALMLYVGVVILFSKNK